MVRPFKLFLKASRIGRRDFPFLAEHSKWFADLKTIDRPSEEDYWSVPIDAVFHRLGSTANGISAKEAEERRLRTGPNILFDAKRSTAIGSFIRQFTNPLIAILVFAAVISAAVREWTDTIVILAIVFGSALISFFQEYSAGKAVDKLRERLTRYVSILRDGIPKRVPVADIVPGDVTLLSAGSLIPADGLVIEAEDCFVNQAILTGETFPVAKSPGVVPEDSVLSEITNCVYMGTSVRSGMTKVLIVRTGLNTVYGGIAGSLNQSAPQTEFERSIKDFGSMLARLMVVLVLAVFAVNVLANRPNIDSLLFALALAVGLSPELLPAIITINLSSTARKLAAFGVIVRRLSAIENLGSMDVLCSDKTGTLTEGVIDLDGSLDAFGKQSERVARLAFINARFQSGFTNPLDQAILASGEFDVSSIKKIGEVPYDFERKRLSVLVRERNDLRTIITKGALENVLEVCTEIAAGPMDENARAQIERRFEEWSRNGFRVLGVATKPLEVGRPLGRDAENEMTFEGFLLFSDPPKKGVKESLSKLDGLGVRLKIITGDNRYVAQHIADEFDLGGSRIISGKELVTASDDALLHIADRNCVFAEVDPGQKERIIRALRRSGHVVGYLGDGINDAPALHDADVGISVEGAADVAREAADFVLTSKGIDVLNHGIEQGRTTFANSLKYILTTTSANFGNMFSMAAASVFLPFLPLLAKQILLNNFLSDIPAIGIAGDNVDREFVRQPHRFNVRSIRNFMILFGLISSFFDFLTFGLLLWVVDASVDEFRTGWFIESLLTELVIALIVRTRRRFYQSKPGKLLWISTVLVAIATFVIPYLPGVQVLGFVPLPASLMAMIAAITLLYVIATETAKGVFHRRFKI